MTTTESGTPAACRPDAPTVKAVVADVLACIGTETMSQCWDAIGDLLWDYYDPYHRMSADQQAAWQAAFREELEGGYDG